MHDTPWYGESVTPIARGRPRSETARSEILLATSALLVERGFDQFTLAEVALRAGVGKQTVYRWWATKASLVAECVLEGILPVEADLVAIEDDPVAAIRAWLTISAARLSQPQQAALFRALNAAAASDDVARAKLTERFHEPLTEAIASALQLGIESGRLRHDLPVSAVADMVIGTMSYSLMRPDGPGESWVEDIMSTLMIGITAKEF